VSRPSPIIRRVHPSQHGNTMVLPEDHVGWQSGRTVLYRFYDEAGELLYVGVTGLAGERWASHSRHADWWPLIAHLGTEVFATMKEALEGERSAIWDERPHFNKRSARA
jgi:excinuclease UvrABC nuclease subunit